MHNEHIRRFVTGTILRYYDGLSISSEIDPITGSTELNIGNGRHTELVTLGTGAFLRREKKESARRLHDILLRCFSSGFISKELFCFENILTLVEDFFAEHRDSGTTTPLTAYDTVLPTVYVIANTEVAYNTYCYGRSDANYLRLTEDLLRAKTSGNYVISIHGAVPSPSDLTYLGVVRIIPGGIDDGAYHEILLLERKKLLKINYEQVWGQ